MNTLTLSLRKRLKRKQAPQRNTVKLTPTLRCFIFFAEAFIFSTIPVWYFCGIDAAWLTLEISFTFLLAATLLAFYYSKQPPARFKH
jgi:hypothetical protein